jgi:maltose-binding protein MalE
MPAIPEYPAINEILNTMVDSAVRGTASVPEALRHAAEATEAILASAGYYAPGRGGAAGR